MSENFEIFLKQKRIDPVLFRKERPGEWKSYKQLFELMGPKSFDHQKKFFFNPLRLSFPLQEPIDVVKPSPKTANQKPKLIPKQTPASDRSSTNKKKVLPKLKPKLSPPSKKPVSKPSNEEKEEKD